MKTYEEAIKKVKLDFLYKVNCESDCKIEGTSEGRKKQASEHLGFWRTVHISQVSLICFIYDRNIPEVVNDLWTALYEDCNCYLDRICVLSSQFPTFAYEFQKELLKSKSMKVSAAVVKVD